MFNLYYKVKNFRVPTCSVAFLLSLVLFFHLYLPVAHSFFLLIVYPVLVSIPIFWLNSSFLLPCNHLPHPCAQHSFLLCFQGPLCIATISFHQLIQRPLFSYYLLVFFLYVQDRVVYSADFNHN